MPVIDPGETFELFLVFRGASGYLYNVNWIDFVGPGIAAGPSDDRAADGDRHAERAGRLRWLVPYADRGDAELRGRARVPDRHRRVDRVPDARCASPPTACTGSTTGHARTGCRRPVGPLDFKLDQAAPTTTAALEGLTTGDTFTGAVRVTLSAADATSGVGAIQWRPAGETAPRAYTAAFTLPAAAGEQAIEYRALDAAGNAEDWKRASFRSPEGIKPTVTLQWPKPGMVVPASGRVPFRVAVGGRDGASCADVTVRAARRARPWRPRRRAAPER